jgi:hypothetical protein
MIRMWRLSEAGEGNLGLACTENGLVLGRTPLVERQRHRFVVRDKSEIERLLRRAYQADIAAERLMPGLATVAAALNADDLCLAAIAAVHLRIPDLPDQAARDGMVAEDTFIKYARDESGDGDWNPALHPRTGTPPNPGWFAPTDSESSPVRTAQNDDPTQRSDASPSAGDDWVRLPPGDYIDELHDFVEWLANAKPEDASAIRAEIKRYYYDVGDTFGGDALNRALSNVLDSGIDPQLHPDLDKDWRQTVLNSAADYAKTDPAEMGLLQGGLPGFVLPALGIADEALESAASAIEEASPFEGDALEIRTYTGALARDPWKLGWAARGSYLHELLGGTLSPTFPVIDRFVDGMATSIKSIDLNAATYQKTAQLTYRLKQYIDDLTEFDGPNGPTTTFRLRPLRAAL